ncbi:HNH endonuclease signature motif containing protein [Pedococcus bigeumensis]|nr:HNH endonuclease signature motif containing protein [Pedococcus bigeumensis]
MEGNLTVEQRREQIAAAREALAGFDGSLWQVPGGGGGGGGGLAGLLGEVDALGAMCEAAKVSIVAEAMERGETSEGAAAMTLTQWVRHHAPSTRAGGAGQLVAVAQEFGKPVNAPVVLAIRSGVLPVRSAAVVLAEADRLRPLLVEGAQPHVLAGLIEMAAQHGPRGCRMVRPALLARYGQDGELQTQQDVARRFVSLSQPVEDGTGTAEYRLVLDVEGKAVLEAALGPLSAPRPVQGDRDLRSCDQRRGEALVTLVRRAVAAGEQVGTNPKAQLVVTMDWESLVAGVRGAGVTVGGSDTGTILAPETVRRLACDASVVPVLLGSEGEVLDQGRAVRFFTPAQTRRLWLRDGGCTYPGCSMPPHWTDAHHLVHWADFGTSDLGNAALLCERHHTIVHSRRYAGQVVHGDAGERVEWDRTLGSYDQLLARRAAKEPA